jgi:biotin carboxyl carrier protein
MSHTQKIKNTRTHAQTHTQRDIGWDSDKATHTHTHTHRERERETGWDTDKATRTHTHTYTHTQTQDGIVTKHLVKEGQAVNKGDYIYIYIYIYNIYSI